MGSTTSNGGIYLSTDSYRFELNLPNDNTMMLNETKKTYRNQYLEVMGGGDHK